MKKEKIIYRKIFKPGDIVILSNKNKGKLPDEAFDFLLTYKKFKVTEVNDNYNIHVGYFLENGNIYYFSPNRFELMSGKAPLKIKNSEGLYDDITEEELENMKKVLKKNTDDEDEQNEVKKWKKTYSYSTLRGSTFGL